VRRAEYRRKRREGANSAFSGEPRRPKSKSCVELLNFMVAFRTFLALSRMEETNEPALRIVKSFAVLSVRERSSGHSEAETAHNSRLTNAIGSVLTIMVRHDIMRQTYHQIYSPWGAQSQNIKNINWLHSYVQRFIARNRILPVTEPS
jgi:hypothetical protein